MPKKLTAKQQQVLNFIESYVRDHGYPPSVRDICQGIGVRSTSTVHGYLTRLEKGGYIKRESTKTRSIVIDHEMPQPLKEVRSVESYIDVPIVGRVAAGEPILAQENIEDTFPIPANYIRSGEYFMLNISGESMVQAGILDGDYVLVRKQQDAKNGDIVVALLDDSATVKTFYRESNMIRLQPENDTMSPIFTRDLEVLGIVKGVFRFM